MAEAPKGSVREAKDTILGLIQTGELAGAASESTAPAAPVDDPVTQEERAPLETAPLEEEQDLSRDLDLGETQEEEEELPPVNLTDDETEEEERTPYIEADGDVEVSNLNELAEAIDVDVAMLYGLKLPYTDSSGNKTEVTLGEIKDNVREFSRVAEERQRFEEEREVFVAENQQAQQLLSQRLTEADQFLTVLQQQIEGEDTSVDWEWLRTNDPAEYSAKKAEMADRKERLAQERAQLQAVANEQLQQHQQEQMAQIQQYAIAEQAKLLEAVPEWKEPTVADAEKQQLAKYLLNSGFTDHDVQTAMDHRLIVVARKAMLYDAGSNKAVKGKQVKKLPRKLSSGAPKPRATAKQEQESKRRNQLKKTGSVKDAALLIRGRMNR